MNISAGIDLGTTYTAAAVARPGSVDVVDLGSRAPQIPSVVFVGDGQFLTGEAAERRALSDPGSVAREFKRRLGDPTPVLVGGSPYQAEELMARLLAWVVDDIVEREGGRPDVVALTHPASWGRYKTELLAAAAGAAGLERTITLSEPLAAAVHYAASDRVEEGQSVAVYDLGGGTFDAAVLTRHEDAWHLRGRPEGIDHLGGIDFDEAVFAHVRRALGERLDELSRNEPATRAGLVRLRADCVAAKEALSADTHTVIPVLLPSVQAEVRLTRAEFEAMIRPALADTLSAMDRALSGSELAPGALRAILLVGGSSRIPLVAEMVAESFGVPVAVDAHPKYGVALGAALAARDGVEGEHRPQVDAQRAGPLARTPQKPSPAPEPAALPAPAMLPADGMAATAGTAGTAAPRRRRADAHAGRRIRPKQVRLVVAVATSVALLAVGVSFLRPDGLPPGEGRAAASPSKGSDLPSSASEATSSTTSPAASATAPGRVGAGSEGEGTTSPAADPVDVDDPPTADPPPPPFARPDGRIAFNRQPEQGASEIFAMNADGSGQVQLTETPRSYHSIFPDISPEGSRIAFVRQGPYPQGSSLFVMNADGSDQRQITPEDGQIEDPAWSPDGATLAFSRYRSGDGGHDLYLVNADGSGERNLTNDGVGGNHPSWSPDGSRLVFSSHDRAGSSSGIFIMDLGSGVISPFPTAAGGLYPEWSPDGTRIAFYAFGQPGLGVVVANADGTNERFTTIYSEYSSGGPTWSPDSTSVAVDQFSSCEVYTMKAVGTELSEVTEVPSVTDCAVQLSWGPA